MSDNGVPGRRAPSFVGVLGGGRMGAGIAHAFCLAGARVAVVERDADSAEAALRPGARVAGLQREPGDHRGIARHPRRPG